MLNFRGMFHTWSGTGETTISLQRDTLHRQIIHRSKASRLHELFNDMFYMGYSILGGLLEEFERKTILNLHIMWVIR